VEDLIEHDLQTRSGRVLEMVRQASGNQEDHCGARGFGPHQDVPGGKTGYVVTRERKARERWSIVKEQIDVALSRELREIDKQIAMEVGQWVEKSDQTRPYPVDRDLPDDVLAEAIERGRRLRHSGRRRRRRSRIESRLQRMIDGRG